MLAVGDGHLPQFWSRFGCDFLAGEDSANVASWATEKNFGAHSFGYDAGEPDYRVGELSPSDAVAMVRFNMPNPSEVRSKVKPLSERWNDLDLLRRKIDQR